MTAEHFASLLLHELKAAEAAATVLEVRTRGKEAVIGLTEDEWLPLLRLAQGSASFNVMSLFVRHGRRWAPTFVRGTPQMLAPELLGPLRFTWAIAAQEALKWRRTSDP